MVAKTRPREDRLCSMCGRGQRLESVVLRFVLTLKETLQGGMIVMKSLLQSLPAGVLVSIIAYFAKVKIEQPSHGLQHVHRKQ